MPNGPAERTYTTGAYAPYTPPPPGRERWLWAGIAGGLLAVALLGSLVRPVCRVEGSASVDEAGVGIRHEQRDGVWYHCEPWISWVLRD